MAIRYTKHVLGEDEKGLQKCVVCGDRIHDYRYVVSESGEKPPSWPEGDFYMSGINPTVMSSEEPKDVEIVDCKNLRRDPLIYDKEYELFSYGISMGKASFYEDNNVGDSFLKPQINDSGELVHAVLFPEEWVLQ